MWHGKYICNNIEIVCGILALFLCGDQIAVHWTLTLLSLHCLALYVSSSRIFRQGMSHSCVELSVYCWLSGVLPVITEGYTPTQYRYLLSQQQTHSLTPLRSLTLTSASFSARYRTVSGLPLWAASCRGVFWWRERNTVQYSPPCIYS